MQQADPERNFLRWGRCAALFLLGVGMATPVRPCTTFCLVDDQRIVFGRNYDYYATDGRVTVNRRGLRKNAFWTNSGLQWVSRFGSLTFSQWGQEFPCGGINETGLVVEHMNLDGTQYPSDSRPALIELQWLQYQLDCSASVEDVLANEQRIRIQPGSGTVHFLVADRTGRCAVIEFLGGRLVCHTDSSLPVAALSNHTYEASLAYAATTSPESADHVSSLGRFVQAAASVRNFPQSHVADSITYAFSALDNVNQPNWTRWSIVYDIGNLSVHFRTQPARSIKQIRLAALDFRPGAPIRTMDINTSTPGDVTPQSVYSAADNLAVLLSVYRQTPSLANVSLSYIQSRAAYPDSVVAISAPSISASPVGQTMTQGGDASFSVSATGEDLLTYQWCKDGVAIAGATSTTLTLSNLTVAQAGDYAAIVTNAAGSVSSLTARLIVTILLAITTQPVSQHVAPGSSATFSVTASGTGPLTYQWKLNGTAIAGATNATYTVANVQAGNMGFYSVTVSNSASSVDSAVAILTVAAGSSRLVSLSTRGVAGAGASTLMPGISLRGTGSKPLLIRGVGPTLGGYGVPNTLGDPKLDVIPVGLATPVVSNDDWGTNANVTALRAMTAALYAFPLGEGSKDAAVLATLATPNAAGNNLYTVQIAPVRTTAQGIALAEVYDTEGATASVRMGSLSTRGFTGPGEQVLTPGFYIAGDGPKQLLIRAVGPTLANYGVGGLLADPQFVVIPQGSDTPVASNDNWGGTAALQAAFTQTYAFPLPLDSRDAAAIVRLPPGGYTVQATGVGGTTGNVLVEVYDMDP